jgi:hypothetical protein
MYTLSIRVFTSDVLPDPEVPRIMSPATTLKEKEGIDQFLEYGKYV